MGDTSERKWYIKRFWGRGGSLVVVFEQLSRVPEPFYPYGHCIFYSFVPRGLWETRCDGKAYVLRLIGLPRATLWKKKNRTRFTFCASNLQLERQREVLARKDEAGPFVEWVPATVDGERHARQGVILPWPFAQMLPPSADMMRASQPLSLSFPHSSFALSHSHLFPAPVSGRLSTSTALCLNEDVYTHWSARAWTEWGCRKPPAELTRRLLTFPLPSSLRPRGLAALLSLNRCLPVHLTGGIVELSPNRHHWQRLSRRHLECRHPPAPFKPSRALMSPVAEASVSSQSWERCSDNGG